MCQGKQDQHIKNCPFYLSFLKKIVSIVSIVVKQNASERRKENQ